MAPSNPFTDYRVNNNLTYKWAAKNLEISPTYYQRLNDGMVSPSASILQKLYELGGDRPFVTMTKFNEFVEAELERVTFPIIPLDRYSTEEDWIIYRELLCSINGIEDSTLGASGLLKINPAILSKWEAGSMKNIPRSILERTNASR